MISFQGQNYQLFFSNNLQPLRALNYADEIFFNEFERLVGTRYRILSIIKHGWQEKYGLVDDIENLKKEYYKKLNSPDWIKNIVTEYEEKKTELSNSLNRIASTGYTELKNDVLASELVLIRRQAAPLDAMSNMLYLFSSFVGDDFLSRLQKYSSDKDIINKNFVYFTQPLKESKYAKILLKELVGKFSLNDEDKNISDIIRTGAYIKDDVSAVLEERGEKMQVLFDGVGKRLKLPPLKLYFLTLDEIVYDLNSGEVVLSDLVSEREKITIIFYNEKKMALCEGIRAETFLKQGNFREISIFSEKVEFKGQTASFGSVDGRAIVVKNSNEANTQIKNGDILVAPYTAPEYVPAMKKAAAIITETGGITSHAAIISRELGIPCVIGIADVTKLIKTGDYLAVDANNGIVKIIRNN
jgi:phosphohistidine swiveling domain-containing protein